MPSLFPNLNKVRILNFCFSLLVLQVIEERAREGEGDNEHIDITSKFINLRDNRKRTALHLGSFLSLTHSLSPFLGISLISITPTAAMAGRLDIVRSLLAAGAQISVLFSSFFPLFLFFSLTSFLSILLYSLLHIPQAVDENLMNPFHFAALNAQKRVGPFCFFLFCFFSSL